MDEGVPSLPPRPMPLPTSPLGRPPPPEDADSPHSSALVPFDADVRPTYVVQVPKDQIFRVPPPENARIVEEHRNRAKTGRTSRPGCLRFAAVFVTLVGLAMLCLCGVIVFYFVASPDVPHIKVARIAVANASSAKPKYDIVMKAQNPSKTMGLLHEDGGKVELFHQGKKIAAGDSPEFDIGHRDTTEIKLSLRGSKATLPKEMGPSAKGSTKDVFPLSLSASFPVRLGLGAFRSRKKELGVDCDFKVSKVGKEMYIKSQNCKASF